MKAATREWIKKAESDWLLAVSLMRRRKPPVRDQVCFHFQQSAEKYVKARMEEAGWGGHSWKIRLASQRRFMISCRSSFQWVMKTKRSKTKAPLPQDVCAQRGVLEPVCSGFAKLLRLLLKLKGWSLGDLAGITHLDKGYLWELANGTSCNPTLDVISRIAHAFRLKLEHFTKLLVRHASKAAVLMPELEWFRWI